LLLLGDFFTKCESGTNREHLMSDDAVNPDPKESVPSWRNRRVWKIIVDGTALAGLAVALIFGLLEHRALEDAREELCYAHAQLSITNEQLRDTRTALQEIGCGTGQLQTVMQRNKTLEVQLGDLQPQVADLTARAQSSDAALKASTQEKAQLARQVEATQRQVADLTTRTQLSDAALKASAQEKADLAGQLQVALRQAADLTGRTQLSDAALKASTQEKADLAGQLQVALRQAGDVNSLRINLRSEQRDHNALVEKYNTLVDRYNDETKKLRDDYNGLVEKYNIDVVRHRNNSMSVMTSQSNDVIYTGGGFVRGMMLLKSRR
jgi:chromosome segregation ATPase